MGLFCILLSHELFGIQEHFSDSKKTASGLMGGIEASALTQYLHIIGFRVELKLLGTKCS